MSLSAIKLIPMKKIFILSLLFIITANLFAGEVDKATVKTVAINFYYERIMQFEPGAHSNVKINEIFQIKEDAITLIYVFNISGGGFVLVSGVDHVRPVPGYSLSGKYSDIGQPPQFMDLLDQYKKQIYPNLSSKVSLLKFSTQQQFSLYNIQQFLYRPEVRQATRGFSKCLCLRWSV